MGAGQCMAQASLSKSAQSKIDSRSPPDVDKPKTVNCIVFDHAAQLSLSMQQPVCKDAQEPGCPWATAMR